MITLKNGCKARNLQEQVAYNAREIARIKHELGERYIEIDDTALAHTGDLTSEQKRILDAYELIYVFLKQDDDLYQVFRTDYYEQKYRKSSIIVSGSLHKLDLDYDNSKWYYSEQTIGGVQAQANWDETDTTSVQFIQNKPDLPNTYVKLLGNEAISGQPYHFPYTIENLRYDTTDNKLKATLFTITLDNNKTLVQYPLEVGIPSGEPANYLKSVDLSTTNQAVFTKKDGSTQTFSVDLSAYRTSTAQDTIDNGKQATLVSGTNIKTINSNSILGSGNITITGEPSAYIKSVNVSTTNSITFTKKDDSTQTFNVDLTSKLDATKCTFQTTAPTAAITDGGVHIVYLTTDPTTKYDGYIYLIKE